MASYNSYTEPPPALIFPRSKPHLHNMKLISHSDIIGYSLANYKFHITTRTYQVHPDP